MVSRHYITSSILPKLYSACKAKLLETIRHPGSALALTTDAWTSRATDNYVTVTLHLINAEWEMHSYVLCTDSFSLSHTSGNLAQHLKETADKWELTKHQFDDDTSSTIYVTTDNASNVLKGKQLLTCS